MLFHADCSSSGWVGPVSSLALGESQYQARSVGVWGWKHGRFNLHTSTKKLIFWEYHGLTSNWSFDLPVQLDRSCFEHFAAVAPVWCGMSQMGKGPCRKQIDTVSAGTFDDEMGKPFFGLCQRIFKKRCDSSGLHLHRWNPWNPWTLRLNALVSLPMQWWHQLRLERLGRNSNRSSDLSISHKL